MKKDENFVNAIKKTHVMLICSRDKC
jgi:hypothetical protein